MLRCSTSPVNNQEKDFGILKNGLMKHSVVFCCYEGHKTVQRQLEVPGFFLINFGMENNSFLRKMLYLYKAI